MAEEIREEIVLNDDELICVLTGEKKKANAKELMLQSVILQMNEEYGFEMSDMKRDYAFSYQDEEDKKKRATLLLHPLGMAWMISRFKQIGGDDKYDGVHNSLCKAMNRRIRHSQYLG